MAEDTKPHLGNLVTAGDGQTEAEKITDTIWMVKDVSNAYLVNTPDGDVLVNTGFLNNGERNKALFAPHRTGPLRKIVLTQAHADHFGALPEQVEPGTEVIAGKGFTETDQYFDDLKAFLGRRSGKLWASMTRRNGPPPVPPRITPDVEVADRLSFDIGGKTFEVIKVPGGETLCSVIVWLPQERTVFTGNLFGPVWRSMPNLTTTRGDKPRLVGPYLESCRIVMDLQPELVITGHGEPVRGADRIRADVQAMHDAVKWIEQETIKVMNAGGTVYEAMQSIHLPRELEIGQFHGQTKWTVRAVWEENGNWFKYEDGTTALFGSPVSSVYADIAELAGGADKVAARAKALLDADKPLEALHLVDIALGVDPAEKRALAVKKHACQLLLARGGAVNLSETMWLKAEIAETEAKLA
ncbi:MBL fold metallo-hydrolase [Novosphingobium sp. TH158]|uniref:MBL fold metallo-hydrolase n=1 Tax=Novosphingobium sp. TH158 TaxID=2067455 RepID=UPI000C7CF730|nr:MBL fold metallo-hydrolase [Novosphingobium sp. TH158]PLK26188.1 MBL fold metallo-hydrolase [Novosphingobium sp. TH158]